ncbi:MAG: ubiquitin-like domain-containing protein, partial [Minisyncoccia bacterium]
LQWTLTCEVQSDDTIAMLSQKIEEKIGLPQAATQFFHHGTRLEGKTTLWKYGVGKEDTLICLAKL